VRLPSRRDTPDDPEDFRATLVEHLEELRNRIFRCLWILGVAWLAGWFLEPYAYIGIRRAIDGPVKANLPKGTEYKNAFFNTTEPFMLQLRLSFMIGLIVAVPFIIHQLWRFIAPGLKKEERKPIQRLGPAASLLFLLGAFFAYAILGPAMGWFAGFLSSFPGASLFQDPGKLVDFSLKMIFAFGVGFELPLLVWVLGALNLLSGDMLMKNWRQGATAIFLIAAIVTPSNDPTSMLMMAIPLTLLFILSIYAVRFTQKRQRRKRELEAREQDA
jgi:sec-independent protein translocase protein TatC